MTKTKFRFLFHFSSLFLKFHSFNSMTFLANLCTYEFFHFFHINTTSQWIAMLFSFFFLDHIWRTEPKLELMLNMSTKTTESSKPHIFLFISRWFDDSFKGRSIRSAWKWVFFPITKGKTQPTWRTLNSQ